MLPVNLPFEWDLFHWRLPVHHKRQALDEQPRPVPVERLHDFYRFFRVSRLNQCQHPFDMVLRLNSCVAEISSLEIGNPKVADNLPVQVDSQRVVQWLHRFGVEHGDLLGGMTFPLFQLRPDLMDGILGLFLHIDLGDGAEDNIGMPADVLHTLPAGKKGFPVQPPLLFAGSVSDGAAFAFNGFKHALLPQSGESGPYNQGAHLKLTTDIADGGELVPRKKITEQDAGIKIIVDNVGHAAVLHRNSSF